MPGLGQQHTSFTGQLIDIDICKESHNQKKDQRNAEYKKACLGIADQWAYCERSY